GRPVHDFVEPDEQTAAVRPGRPHGELPGLLVTGARPHHGVLGEPHLGDVGADIHRDLPADAVWLGDPADDYLHATSTPAADASAIGVDDVDPHAAAADPAHHRAQRGGGTATTADDLAEIVRVDVHLERAAAPRGDQLHPDVIRVVDDAPHQVLERIGEEAHSLSALPSSPDSAFASSFLDSLALASLPFLPSALSFFADFFLPSVASASGRPPASSRALANSSSLDGFGSATFSLPSAPGRPLNFCQSPVIRSE